MRRRSSIGGRRLGDGSVPSGFTLIEIIVVLALIGMTGALVIGGSDTLIKSVSRDNAENLGLGAIASARQSAVLTGRIVELRNDEKARALDWGAGRATLVGENDELRLLPPKLVSSAIVGGRVREEPLARVRFYPDGTCDPFRLEIISGGNKASRLVVIDPWTCTALAPETEASR